MKLKLACLQGNIGVLITYIECTCIKLIRKNLQGN